LQGHFSQSVQFLETHHIKSVEMWTEKGIFLSCWISSDGWQN